MTSASASCPDSEAADPRSAAAVADAPPRLSLGQLLQRFGRVLCQDRYRCAGLIHDLCEGTYREHYLWTVALQEGIAAELLMPPQGVPPAVLLPALSQKLTDRLGLSREAAGWAVQSWSEALQNAPEQTEASFAPPIAALADAGESHLPSLARHWLGWCTAALTAAVLALAVAGWCAFHFDVSTLGRWLQETAVLAGGCVLSWWGLRISSRRIVALQRPDWLHLPPVRAVAATLPEILLILLLPLTPVGEAAFWAAACWSSWPHASGPVQVAWVLARLVQALLLAVFISAWTPPMIETEGRLIAGWRECR